MLLRQAEILLYVLQERSFTLAAERLDLTQPAVSHAVASLERHLNLRLLHRARTGVQLTPDGERLLPYVQQLARAAERLREEAARPPHTVSGKVRIGSFPSTSIHILPRVIRTLARQHPQVDVLIFEGVPDEIARWLDQGTIDLGFLESPYPQQLDSQPVLSDEYRLLLPADHPLASRRQVEMHELSGEPFVLSKFGCEPVLRAAFGDAKATLNVTYEVRDLTTLLAMVREGLGVSMIPDLLLTQLPGDLKSVPVRPAVRRDIALAQPRGTPLSLPALTLRSAILHGMADLPPGAAGGGTGRDHGLP